MIEDLSTGKKQSFSRNMPNMNWRNNKKNSNFNLVSSKTSDLSNPLEVFQQSYLSDSFDNSTLSWLFLPDYHQIKSVLLRQSNKNKEKDIHYS